MLKIFSFFCNKIHLTPSNRCTKKEVSSPGLREIISILLSAGLFLRDDPGAESAAGGRDHAEHVLPERPFRKGPANSPGFAALPSTWQQTNTGRPGKPPGVSTPTPIFSSWRRVFCLGSCALPSGSQEGGNKTKAPRKLSHFRGNPNMLISLPEQYGQNLPRL